MGMIENSALGCSGTKSVEVEGEEEGKEEEGEEEEEHGSIMPRLMTLNREIKCSKSRSDTAAEHELWQSKPVGEGG